MIKIKMNRIEDYLKLEERIIIWIKEYVENNNIKALVCGVSGGIDSAVVSTLCAKTGIPTYVLSMPLKSSDSSDNLSDSYTTYLENNYDNVTKIRIDLGAVYQTFITSFDLWTGVGEYTDSGLVNANTKSRMRMVALYQVAGTTGGIVVGTGNKVEDYGIGFYTKYGDGGVDIAPIADLYKTEVWELGKHLGVDQRIVDAPPTDGLWDDSRTDEDQIGCSYDELEWAMTYEGDKSELGPRDIEILEIYNKFNTQNKHKMDPIPVYQNV